ncbi:MAG: hypothetical protein ACTIIC_13885, partial [Brevibacterium aurantiacum]
PCCSWSPPPKFSLSCPKFSDMFHSLVDDIRPRPAVWLPVFDINSLDTRECKENCVKLAQVSEAVHFLPIFTASSDKTVAVNDVSTR